MQNYQKTIAYRGNESNILNELNHQNNFNPSEQSSYEQAQRLKEEFPFLLENDNEFLIAYFWLVLNFSAQDAISRLELSKYSARKHWVSLITKLKQFCDSNGIGYRDLFPLSANSRFLEPANVVFSYAA